MGEKKPDIGEDQAERIARTASEVKWRQTMLTLHLKSLRRCVSPRQSRRQFYGYSVESRVEVAEVLLGEITLHVAGLLRGVNEIRRITRGFIAEAESKDPARVPPGG